MRILQKTNHGKEFSEALSDLHKAEPEVPILQGAISKGSSQTALFIM